jgi:hypothetical protein
MTAATVAGLSFYGRNTPTPPYKIWTRFRLAFGDSNSGNSFGGLCWLQTSDNHGQMWSVRSNNKPIAYSVGDIATPSFTNLYDHSEDTVGAMQGPFTMGFEDDGTNRSMVFCPDGYNSVPVVTMGRTSVITPDKAGFFVGGVGPWLITLESWREL